MPAAPVKRLHLEDTLDESPQTRAMVDLFEKDMQMLKKFSKAFTSSCQKISSAQIMMISATQELSYYLRLYGKQNYPLEPKNEKNEKLNEDEQNNIDDNNQLSSTLNQFANYIDEVSTCFQVFVTQINDSLIYPLNKLVETEFEELSGLGQAYQSSIDEQEQAMQKYLRLPFKKEYDAQQKQISQELFMTKKKYHQTSLNYFSSLNLLQFKRQYMLVEPLISYIHSLKMFFKMGSETLNPDSSKIDDFLNKTSTNICEIKTELSDEINKNNQMIELLQNDESIYNPEQLDIDPNPSKTNESILQKQGYLNLRSRFPFIFNWERSFYFIQNGCLMHQQKNEIAGYIFLELKSDLTVGPCEIDDRRYTFQINSQFPKKVIYLQANSEQDKNEWINILRNAIKDDNRAKILNYMNTASVKTDNFSNTNSTRANFEANIKFELSDAFKKNLNLKSQIAKPQQGESFKVRFLGSMNVKADKGNEYIHETIRQVMATRAKENIFKMNEFNLIVNNESLSLFSIPATSLETNNKLATLKPDEVSSDDLLKAKFNLADLAFWSTHTENKRLFGFIIKEATQTLKFLCLVFESDVDSFKICESITKATQLAFQLLIDENKSEHFKKIKQTEKEILLQNIKSLPDEHDINQAVSNEVEDSGQELLDAAYNSPNPNFVILDRDLLENFSQPNENLSTSETSISKANKDNSESDA